MTNSKELFERRKHKRFHVQDGAFAVLRPHYAELLGQIIDISRGGVSFRYIASEELSNGSFKLDILLGNTILATSKSESRQSKYYDASTFERY